MVTLLRPLALIFFLFVVVEPDPGGLLRIWDDFDSLFNSSGVFASSSVYLREHGYSTNRSWFQQASHRQHLKDGLSSYSREISVALAADLLYRSRLCTTQTATVS